MAFQVWGWHEFRRGEKSLAGAIGPGVICWPSCVPRSTAGNKADGRFGSRGWTRVLPAPTWGRSLSPPGQCLLPPYLPRIRLSLTINLREIQASSRLN